MKYFLKFLICFLFFPSFVYASTSQGNKMADVGAKFACGETRIYAQWSSTRIYNNVTSHYIDARDKYIVNAPDDDGSYASCDVGVATIVRSSGVDPNFTAFLVPKQWNYLKDSDDWKQVGIYYKGTSTSFLQPGDVMIVNPDVNNSGNDYMHIWMYLGNAAVRKYYPNSNADSVEAGYSSYPNGSYYPTLFNASENAHGDPRPYSIFRYDGVDEVSGILKWASQVTGSTFVYESVDACSLISGEFQKYINDFFNLISIVGIILVIVMSMINLVKVIAGNDSEGLQKFFQNLKSRIITLIVLLILPFLITFILNTVNEVAPLLGYNSDNPFCTSNSN